MSFRAKKEERIKGRKGERKEDVKKGRGKEGRKKERKKVKEREGEERIVILFAEIRCYITFFSF